jgi:hypothetical protein
MTFLTVIGIAFSWITFSDPGAIAIQFDDSRAVPTMASVEWVGSCGLRRSDRRDSAGHEHELCNARHRGFNQAAATAFLSALGRPFRHIRRHEIDMHREWMIRAFAVGLAVATIRPIIGMFFATSRFSGMTAYQFFGTASWIGFVLHLMAAEIWIHRTTPRTELESLQN